MILKLGVQLWVLKHYQIPSNEDPRLNFDLFTQRSVLVPYVDIHMKLNEYREINMYQRSRSLFVLCPRSLIFH